MKLKRCGCSLLPVQRRYTSLAIVVAIAIGFSTRASSAVPSEFSGQRVSFEENHMGAPGRLHCTLPTKRPQSVPRRPLFARIEQLNGVLSDYDPDSELSRLSDTAPSRSPVPVSDDLWRVLEFSQQLSEKTDGAFDITVGPLVHLWRRARRTKEMPGADLLAAALEATGYRGLQLDRALHTARLMKPKMRLDAGGIGMGYAVDEAMKVLKREGIRSALIDASGDIGVSDPPPDAAGWRIAIEPPAGEGTPSRNVLLKNQAITTSGDAFQAVEIAGKRYSHIVNPHAGLGLTQPMAVTVIAPDCITADSFTKPICVLGPSRGFQLIEATPGAAAFVEQGSRDANGKPVVKAFETSRFRSFVVTPGPSTSIAN